jgi:hypothetical protein
VVPKQLTQIRPEQKIVVVSAAADTRIKVRCLQLGNGPASPTTSSGSVATSGGLRDDPRRHWQSGSA